MIDARDYKTHEELEKAMQYEHDISELNFIKKQMASLTVKINTINHRYSVLLNELKRQERKLSNSIREYQKEYS